eukprot:6174074-Pleurochrysis_carterae.AAC.1
MHVLRGISLPACSLVPDSWPVWRALQDIWWVHKHSQRCESLRESCAVIELDLGNAGTQPGKGTPWDIGMPKSGCSSFH